MKKLFVLLLALVMSLSLIACGGDDSSTDTSEEPAVEETSGADIQRALDAFDSATTAFDVAANAINEDLEAYPQELIDTMNEMYDSLIELQEVMESDNEFTEEQVDEFVSLLNQVQTWSEDVAANLDTMTIEATTVDTSIEAVIEYFNYVSPRFNAISAVVNENIEAFPDEFIEGMIEVATGLNEYQEVLQSGVELTEDERMQILEDLLLVDEWVTAQEESLAEAG